MLSCQRVFLFAWSIIYACSIEVGTYTLYLCDIFLIYLLTVAIIISQRRKVYVTHQQISGLAIPLTVTNSATSKILDSLVGLRYIYYPLPSLSWIRKWHSLVVFLMRIPQLLVATYMASLLKALSYFLKYNMLSRIPWEWPSRSIFA